MSKSITMLGLMMVAVLAVAACSSDKKPAPGTSGNPVSASSSSSSSASSSSTAAGAPTELKVLAVEAAPNTFTFDIAGVQSVRAGTATVTLSNTGVVSHEVRFAKVRDGNFDEYKSAVSAQGALGSTPLADEVGAVGPVDPGKSATSTILLTSGPYALVCFLTGPSDGKTFAQHGMITELDVKPTTAG
jgi:plastocyanin